MTTPKTLPILRFIAALTVLILTTTASATPLASEHLRGGQPVEAPVVGLEQALSRKPAILVTAAVTAVFGAGFVAGYTYRGAKEPHVVQVTVQTQLAPAPVDRLPVAPPMTPPRGGLEETIPPWERLEVNMAVFRLQEAVEKAQGDRRPLRALFDGIRVDDITTEAVAQRRADVLTVAKSNPTGVARPVSYRQRGDTVWISPELDPTQVIVVAIWSDEKVRQVIERSLGDSLWAHGIKPGRQLFLVSDIRGAQAIIEQYHDRLGLVMTNEANVHETVDTVRRTSPTASVILMEKDPLAIEAPQRPLRDLVDGFGSPYEWPTGVAPVLQREFFARLAPADGLEERPTEAEAALGRVQQVFAGAKKFQEVQVFSRQTVAWFPWLVGLLHVPDLEGRVLVEPEAGPAALVEVLRQANSHVVRYYGTTQELRALEAVGSATLEIEHTPLLNPEMVSFQDLFLIRALSLYLGAPKRPTAWGQWQQFKDDLATLA